MPINFTDFSNIPIREKGIGNIFSDILTGFKMEREPARMAAEQKKLDIANALEGINLEFKRPEKEQSLTQQQLNNKILGVTSEYARPNAQAALEGIGLANKTARTNLQWIPGEKRSEIALRNAQVEKALGEAKAATDPLAKALGVKGDIQDAFALEKIKSQYGEDSEVYQNAKRFIENSQGAKTALTENRQVNTQLAPKRMSSMVTKLMNERNSVESGIDPITGEQLTPEKQEELLGQYDAAVDKAANTAVTIKKSDMFNNAEKTINKVLPNIDALFYYSGPKGKTELLIDKGRAAAGNPSKRFIDYSKAKTNMDLYAEQVSQGYGSSIQPSEKQHIRQLTNPSNFLTPASVAKPVFMDILDTVQREAATFSKGRSKERVSSNFNANQSSGTTKIYMNGKSHTVPNNRVQEALNNGGSLTPQ